MGGVGGGGGDRLYRDESCKYPVPGAAGAQRRLTDRRLPIRPEEEAADLLPQLCRDIAPVPSPVPGQ